MKFRHCVKIITSCTRPQPVKSPWARSSQLLYQLGSVRRLHTDTYGTGYATAVSSGWDSHSSTLEELAAIIGKLGSAPAAEVNAALSTSASSRYLKTLKYRACGGAAVADVPVLVDIASALAHAEPSTMPLMAHSTLSYTLAALAAKLSTGALTSRDRGLVMSLPALALAELALLLCPLPGLSSSPASLVWQHGEARAPVDRSGAFQHAWAAVSAPAARAAIAQLCREALHRDERERAVLAGPLTAVAWCVCTAALSAQAHASGDSSSAASTEELFPVLEWLHQSAALSASQLQDGPLHCHQLLQHAVLWAGLGSVSHVDVPALASSMGVSAARRVLADSVALLTSLAAAIAQRAQPIAYAQQGSEPSHHADAPEAAGAMPVVPWGNAGGAKMGGRTPTRTAARHRAVPLLPEQAHAVAAAVAQACEPPGSIQACWALPHAEERRIVRAAAASISAVSGSESSALPGLSRSAALHARWRRTQLDRSAWVSCAGEAQAVALQALGLLAYAAPGWAAAIAAQHCGPIAKSLGWRPSPGAGTISTPAVVAACGGRTGVQGTLARIVAQAGAAAGGRPVVARAGINAAEMSVLHMIQAAHPVTVCTEACYGISPSIRVLYALQPRVIQQVVPKTDSQQ